MAIGGVCLRLRRAGPIFGHVDLIATTFDGEQLPAVPVALRGRVAPELRAIPGDVDFGAFGPGANEVLVTIQSARRRAFTIASVTAEGDVAVTSHPNTLRPAQLVSALGGVHQLKLSARPSAAGHCSGRVTVSVLDADGGPVELVVSVRGYALHM